MCGITGYYGQGDREILKAMTDAIAHRGPDDDGYFVYNQVGMGHRRLSIIDLQTGRQPIINEDGTVVVIFNGEIYNFHRLKQDLIKQGHIFTTNTDTEVLVHLYEEKGIGFLNDLNGMFALSLYDKRKRKLILARDRLGEKPLYYYYHNKSLVFGSELKAILKYPDVKKEINLSGLAKYLNYEYVPVPETMFAEIYKLGPGEYLQCRDGQIEIKKYWDINFDRHEHSQTKEFYIRELDKLLSDSVKKRLISDVPLGIFLSGGIDSSTIAYYAQKNSLNQIKTFSIGFNDKSFDESKYANQVAKQLNTDHHHQILSGQDCVNLIDKITGILDEPLADASIVPTYLLSDFTKKYVTVALSGDGADELLMGYPTILADRLSRYYHWVPKIIRTKIIEKAINSLPPSFKNISFDFKLKRAISGQDYSREYRNQIWLGSFGPNQIGDVLTSSVKSRISVDNIFEGIDKYKQDMGCQTPDNQLIYLYLKNYLQDDILVKTDRASMAVGLEVRAPFLDYRLVDFINSIPNDLKFKRYKGKYILKQLMKDRLPQNIINRPKKGFGMPVAYWIENEFKDLIKQAFSYHKINQQGLFDYEYVNKLLADHLAHKKDNRKLIWTLFMFQRWYDQWFEN